MLEFAYAGNILVVTPVLYLLWFREDGPARIYGKHIEISHGMNVLIASMWSAIVLLSIAGLRWEKELVGLLIFQCIYKVIFLGVYVAPRALAGDWDKVPKRLSVLFILGLIFFLLVIWQQLVMR
ncbi:hypothetical protein ACKTEK_05195 [Tepidamorphus sp. 3E244]|uniref:hypothetical protein n=1 Tax=Tepidamorphus sp. 3E244 TaxID=3385498 RepID=UPI0038FC5D0A